MHIQRSVKRLYKNKNIQKNITRMAKLNLPNLIEICPNNNEHIIIESIKNLLNTKKDKHSLIKTIRKPILKYYSLYYAAFEQASIIQKQDPENIKDILESQQIYDLKMGILRLNIKDKVTQQTDTIIKQIIEINIKNKEPAIPKDLTDTIKMVREGVPTQTKEQWIMNEALIEKIDNYIEYNIQP